MISKQQPLNHNDISKPIDAGHDESAYAQQSSGKSNQSQLAGKIQDGGNTAQQKLSSSGANVGGLDGKTLGAGAAGAGAVGAAGVSHYEVHKSEVATRDGTQVTTTETYHNGAPSATGASSGTSSGAPTSRTASGPSGAAAANSNANAPTQYSIQDPHAQNAQAKTHGNPAGSNSGHHSGSGAGAGAAAGTPSGASAGHHSATEDKAAAKNLKASENDAKKDAKESKKESKKEAKDAEDEVPAKPKSDKELAQEQYKGANTIEELQGMPGVPHKSELVDLGDAKKGPVLGPRPDYDCTPQGKAEGPGKQSSTREATLATYSGTDDVVEPAAERKTSQVDAHKEHATSNHPTREVPTHGPKPTSYDSVNTSAAANPHHPSNSSNRDEAALGSGAGAASGAGAGAASGHSSNAVVSGAGHNASQPQQDYTANDRSAGNHVASGRSNVQEPAFAPTANTGASNYEGVPQQSAGYTSGSSSYDNTGYNTTDSNQNQPRGTLAAAGAAVAGALGLGSYTSSGNNSENARTTGNYEQTELPSSGHNSTAGNYERSATGSSSAGYDTTATTGHSSGPSATGYKPSHSSSVPHGSQNLSSGDNDKLAGQIKQGGSTAQEQIGKSGASVGGVDNKTLGAGAAGAGAVGAAGATEYGKHHSSSSSQPTTQHSSTQRSTGAPSGSSNINHSSQPGFPSETVGTGAGATSAAGHSSSHSSQGPSSAGYSSTGNNDKLAGQIKQGGNTAQQEIGKSGASVGGVDNKTLGAGAAGAGALGAAGATQYGKHSSSQHSSSQPSASHSTSHSQPQYSQSSSSSHSKPVTHTGRSGYPEESDIARSGYSTTTGSVPQGSHAGGPSTGASGSQNLSSSSGNNDKLAGQIKQGGNTAQQEIGKSGASVGGVDNKTLGAGAAGAGAVGAAGASHYNKSHSSSSQTSSSPSSTQNYSQGSSSHHSQPHHTTSHSSHHSNSKGSEPVGYAGTTTTAGASGAREVPHGIEGHSTHGPATTSDHTSYGASGHAGQGSTGTSAPTSGHYASGTSSGAGSTGRSSSGNNDKLAGQIKQGGNTAQEQIGKSGASFGGVDNKTLGAGAAGAGALGAAGASHYNKSHGTNTATSGSTTGSAPTGPRSGAEGHSSTGPTGQGVAAGRSGVPGSEYTKTQPPTGDFEGPYNTQGHSASHELSTREATNGQSFGHSQHAHSGSGAAVGAGAGAGAGAASHHLSSSTPSHATQAPATSSSNHYQQQPATSHAATSAHHSTQSDAQGGRYVSNSDTTKYEQSPQYAQGNTYNSAGQPVADANGEPMQSVQRTESSQSKGPLAAIAGALGFGGAKAESDKTNNSSTVTSDNYNRDDYNGIGTSTDDQYRSGSTGSTGHQTQGLAHGTNAKHQPVDGVSIGSQYTDVTKGNSYKNNGKLQASYGTEHQQAGTTTLPEQRLPEEPVSGVAGKQPVELRTAGNGPIKYQ